MFILHRSGRKRILSLILVMFLVAFISEGIGIGILYFVFLDNEKILLLNTAKSQARLIEAIVLRETGSSKSPDKATAKILTTIRAANNNFAGFGESGEFTLAELQGKHAVFLFRHRHEELFGILDKHTPVPFGSEFDEPMQSALKGESGALIGNDYRHVKVIAGYEPIRWEGKTVGIVAKVDLKEFQRPYVIAVIVSCVISVLIILIGAFAFLKISNPLIEKFEDTEVMFRRVLNEMGVGMVIVNLKGGVLKANEAFCRMLGFSEEEVLRKNVFDMTHPDDHACTRGYFAKLIAGEISSFKVEKRYLHMDGSLRWGFENIVAISNREKPAFFIVHIHEITKRKKWEETIRSWSERYEATVKASGHILFDWNVKADEITYGGGIEEVLGYEIDELRGGIGVLEGLVHDEDISSFKERLHHCIESKEPFLFECRAKRKDRFFIDLEIDGHFISNSKGRITRMVGFVRDNTLRKKTRESLEKANSEIKAFANIVSHDLRSPLMNVKGLSRQIRTLSAEAKNILAGNSEKLTDEQSRRLDYILSQECDKSLKSIELSVKTMENLISRILHLSKIGKLTLNIAEVDMNQLVGNRFEMLSHQIRSRNVEVKVGELPVLQADSSAMDQIVGNILSNAMNYLSPDRPGRIEVIGRKVQWDNIYVFRDNGVGIPEKEKNKVFEIFRRGSNVSETKGEGMGMAYVKALVERHGGEIWFESVEHEGTAFFVAFPQASLNK